MATGTNGIASNGDLRSLGYWGGDSSRCPTWSSLSSTFDSTLTYTDNQLVKYEGLSLKSNFALGYDGFLFGWKFNQAPPIGSLVLYNTNTRVYKILPTTNNSWSGVLDTSSVKAFDTNIWVPAGMIIYSNLDTIRVACFMIDLAWHKNVAKDLYMYGVVEDPMGAIETTLGTFTLSENTPLKKKNYHSHTIVTGNSTTYKNYGVSVGMVRALPTIDINTSYASVDDRNIFLYNSQTVTPKIVPSHIMLTSPNTSNYIISPIITSELDYTHQPTYNFTPIVRSWTESHDYNKNIEFIGASGNRYPFCDDMKYPTIEDIMLLMQRSWDYDSWVNTINSIWGMSAYFITGLSQNLNCFITQSTTNYDGTYIGYCMKHNHLVADVNIGNGTTNAYPYLLPILNIPSDRWDYSAW